MEIFTIGHSTHSVDRFVGLLQKYDITAVCDVRSSPRSSFSPHFDKYELRDQLRANGIEYVFLGNELGARPKDKACYENGKALYSLISETQAFKSGLSRIRKGVNSFNVALMCAEQDPITCHRTILVCRHLTDLSISHILPDGSIEQHMDSMKRLISTLGVRGGLEDVTQSIINSAYDVQGRKICYSESVATDDGSTESMESFL